MFDYKDVVGTSPLSIAEVCNCSPEQVAVFLNRLREQILISCFQKKKNVRLNLLVGSLSFSAQGTVEFKSASAKEIVTNSEKAASRQMTEPSQRSSKRSKLRVLGKDGSQAPAPKARLRELKTSFRNNRHLVNKKNHRGMQDQGKQYEENDYGHLKEFLRS